MTSPSVTILLATPVAGGVVTHDYMHGISHFRDHCASLGWGVAHVTQPDGLVTRSRNSFASMVVRDPKFTHLLMLDADVIVPPEGLARLIRSGHDLVGSSVPLRNVSWQRAADFVAERPEATLDEVRAVATEYAVWFDQGSGAVDGFIPVRAVGSGSMLVTRDALVRLSESDQVSYAQFGIHAADQREDGWTFFDPLVDDGGIYLSEDYALCHRWRKLGGQVWADLETPTRHIGPVRVDGNVKESLTALTALTRQRRAAAASGTAEGEGA